MQIMIEILLCMAVYVAGVFLGRLWQWWIDEKKKEEDDADSD